MSARDATTGSGWTSRTRATISLGLFLAFLLGLAGEAYGFHHHHAHGRDLPASAGAAQHAHAAHGLRDGFAPAASPPSADPPVERSREARPSDCGDTEFPTDGDPCTCLGMCHGASASPPPSSPPDVHAGAALALGDMGPADDDGPLRPPTPYLLPFANGPPPR